MKKTFQILLLVFSLTLFAQSNINIGSTKDEVKRIQGEPTSIEVYDELGQEIWGYGSSGIATITFEKGKIKSFRNYDNILKIGNNSKKSQLKNKLNEDGTNPYIENLKEAGKDPNLLNEETTTETSRSITGLYGGGRQGIKRIPDEYKEVAEANNLSPYDLPDEYRLKEMKAEYDREKYTKYALFGLGALLLGYLFFRFKTRE